MGEGGGIMDIGEGMCFGECCEVCKPGDSQTCIPGDKNICLFKKKDCCMVFGLWHILCGISCCMWCMIYGVWYVVFGNGILYMPCGR